MVKLSEEAKKLIADIRVAQVATASKAGKPNVSPKGSFRALDDEHVAFGSVRSPRTMANIKENPQVTAILFDPATRNGVRIWGKAEIIDSDAALEEMRTEYAPKNVKIEQLVKIAVDEVETF